MARAGKATPADNQPSPLFLDHFVADFHERYKKSYPLLAIGVAVLVVISFFTSYRDHAARKGRGEAHYALHLALTAGDDEELSGKALREKKIERLEVILSDHGGQPAAVDAAFHIARLKIANGDPAGFTELSAWEAANPTCFPLTQMALLVAANGLIDSGKFAEGAAKLEAFTQQLPEDSEQRNHLRLRLATVQFLGGESEQARKELGLLSSQLEQAKEEEGDDFREGALLEEVGSLLDQMDAFDPGLLRRFVLAADEDALDYEGYQGQRNSSLEQAEGLPLAPVAEPPAETEAVDAPTE